MASKVFEQDHVVEAQLLPDGGGLLVKTRDADRFYRQLNQLALGGISIEGVAPADDNVNSVYEYLIGGEEGDEMTRQRVSQILAVIRLECSKTFFARRGLWVYLLAFAPVLLFAATPFTPAAAPDAQLARLDRFAPPPAETLCSIQGGLHPRTGRTTAWRALLPTAPATSNPRECAGIWTIDTRMEESVFILVSLRKGILKHFGTVDSGNTWTMDLTFSPPAFQSYYLRLAIFFGCVGIFTNLFRGEMLDKSLHFICCADAPARCFWPGNTSPDCLPRPSSLRRARRAVGRHAQRFRPRHIGRLISPVRVRGSIFGYLAVTVLACIGYGGVFVAAGMFFPQPADSHRHRFDLGRHQRVPARATQKNQFDLIICSPCVPW